MRSPLLTRRRLAAGLLSLAVVALHLLLATRVVQAWPQPADRRPQRLQAAFVRLLQPQAPLAVVAAAAPPKPTALTAPTALAAPPAPAASAAAPEPPPPAAADAPPPAAAGPTPEPAREAPLEPAAPATAPPTAAPPATTPPAAAPPIQTADAAPAGAPAPLPDAVPALASAAASGPDAASPQAVAAAAAPAFEWPPSTRLSYVLSGNYRGPVDGSAQVQWLREGEHYQVHLDVQIGPPFAALIERQMSSDGRLGAQGLVPRRYDEATRIAFRSPRVLTMWFDADEVQLASGRRVPSPPGVQDTVSQFIQLSWRFTLQPALLKAGTVIELPLALPRRVETWTYDVGASEPLATAAGVVDAVHVKPRRTPRPGGDLVAEMWIAPTLQYLPVRIVIRQDEQTWVDLMLRSLPEQAAAVPSPPSPTAPSASTDTARRP